MKKSLILLPLAAVLLSLTGCKKDNEKSGPSGETVTFTANIGGGEKTEIYNGTKMKWSEGDAITINGDEFTSDFSMGDYTTANFVGTFTGTPTEYKAYYPETLYKKDGGTYELPATQTYNGSTLSGINPMYAYQPNVNNKTLQFHNICALVKLQVTGTGTVKQIVVTSTDPLCGEFEPKTDDNVHYYAHITGSGNTVTLNCEGGVALDPTTPKTFYIALPQGELKNLTFKCSGDAGEWKATPITTATLTAGKLYTKSLENVEMKPVFSVSATTTVEFAPGNLYYNGADGAEMNTALPSGWNFYGHQWDCYPSETESVTESMEINLFTWGYGEWSTVYDTKLYQTGSGAMTDWGRVAIGGDPANTWRTLTNDEWSYLLNTSGSSGRTDANRFAKAKVNGVRGLLIFPDGYNGTTSGNGIAALNATNVAFPADDIPEDTWSSMESSGAVFLPAAGYRYGEDGYDVGSYGCYWSSTPYEDDENGAYGMDFYSDDAGTYNDDRDYGSAVRLVR